MINARGSSQLMDASPDTTYRFLIYRIAVSVENSSAENNRPVSTLEPHSGYALMGTKYCWQLDIIRKQVELEAGYRNGLYIFIYRYDC